MLGLRITGLMPNTPETGAAGPPILPPDLGNRKSHRDNNTSHRGSSRSHRGNRKSHRVSSTGVAGRPNPPRPSLLLLSLLSLQSSRGSSMGAVGHPPGTFPQPSHLNPLLNLDTPTSNLSLLNLTSSQFLNLLHSSSPSDKRLRSLCS